ncbi:ComEC family competence protein, partial [bacterium]|nr:ComEC family competence protein [bacterium]
MNTGHRDHFIRFIIGINSFFLKKKITVSGTVLADPLMAQNGRFVTVFQLDSLHHNNSTRAVRGKIRLTVPPNHPTLIAGHYLKITGFLRKPTSARNPGAFDYADYLAVKKIYGIFRVGKQDSILIEGHKNRPWLQLQVINPVRRSIKKRIKTLMPPLQAALVQAMLLGERNEIPRELTSNLAKTGTSHILAVSGLHTGLILIIIITVLRLLHVPARFRNPLTITALAFFCFLTGLNPPVVRASLMASFWLIGRQSQRFCDPMNIIATAATLILLIKPLLLFTAGFQLSFGAVIGIILIRPVILKRLKSIPQLKKMYHTPVLHWVIELVIVTFSAQVAMMPLLIFHFSSLPLLGVIANLVAIPLLGLILPLGIVALLVSIISPFLAQFFVETNSILISVLTFTVKNLAQLPGSHTYCRLPALSSILLYYAALIAFLTYSPKIRKGMIISLLVLANLNIWGSAFTPRPLFRLIFFDVGQGDSALFSFKN